MTQCDQIANRMAAGEELNENQREHAEICPSCSAAGSATEMLGAIGRARGAVSPGPGFSSRMVNRAWDRVAVRRRNRIIGYSVASTGALAAAALAFALLRPGSGDPMANQNHAAAIIPEVDPLDHMTDPTPADNDSPGLIWLTDADRALDYSANWDFIEKPLAPYALLLGDAADLEDGK